MVPLIRDIPLFHEIYILFDFTFIQCVSHLHETMATLTIVKVLSNWALVSQGCKTSLF